jgi:hypothetical protein
MVSSGSNINMNAYQLVFSGRFGSFETTGLLCPRIMQSIITKSTTITIRNFFIAILLIKGVSTKERIEAIKQKKGDTARNYDTDHNYNH